MPEPRLNQFDYIGPGARHHVTQAGLGGQYRVRSNPFGAIVDAIKGFCSIAPMVADDSGGYEEYPAEEPGGGYYYGSGSGGGSGLWSPYDGGGNGGGSGGGLGMDCPTGSMWDPAFGMCVPNQVGGGGMMEDPPACNPMARMMQREKLRQADTSNNLANAEAVAAYAADCVGRTKGDSKGHWQTLRGDANRVADRIRRMGDGDDMMMTCPTGEMWDASTMMCRGMMGGGGGGDDEPATCNRMELERQRMLLTGYIEMCNLSGIRGVQNKAAACVMQARMGGELRPLWANLRDRAAMEYDAAAMRCMDMGGGPGGGPGGGGQLIGPPGEGMIMDPPEETGCGVMARQSARQALQMAVRDGNEMAACQIADQADRCAMRTMGDNRENWRELARDARRECEKLRMMMAPGMMAPTPPGMTMLPGMMPAEQFTNCSAVSLAGWRARLNVAKAAGNTRECAAVVEKCRRCLETIPAGQLRTDWMRLMVEAQGACQRTVRKSNSGFGVELMTTGYATMSGGGVPVPGGGGIITPPPPPPPGGGGGFTPVLPPPP